MSDIEQAVQYCQQLQTLLKRIQLSTGFNSSENSAIALQLIYVASLELILDGLRLRMENEDYYEESMPKVVNLPRGESLFPAGVLVKNR